ncbi:MAG TPA: serpin family protein [Dehalococcoidia bacterium]|nr:serpin family protein [Dehalococcoidia bacterium]
MKKIFILIATVILISSFAACSVPVASAMSVKSDKPRVTLSSVDNADLTALVDGNTVFTLDLYQELKDKEGNIFYSPHSLSVALAMTYAGARGETEQQMAKALSFFLSQDRLHPTFNFLDQLLASRGEGAQGKDDEGFRLNIVNDIWGQKDFTFLADFLDTLAVNYGAGLRILDFINEPEASRVAINDYIYEQTEEKIKDLIPEGVIDPMTRLVLTNAIYFNAAWLYPFSEDLTSDGIFHLLDGGEVTVPMMHQGESLGYTEGDNYQAVELKYDGEELSMIILLPEMGQFENFETALDAELLNDIINNLESKHVELTLPKWEYESSFMMKEVLKAMGMPIAFTDGADFSGMTGRRDLYIDEVIHKAFVSVDEAGTEAAAASAVIMKLTAMPTDTAVVTVDRPFIYLIRDIETGAILFFGRVVNPA